MRQAVRRFGFVPSGAASLALAFLMSAAPPEARAQLGEPHGFVEPCTVGNEQEMDTDCELCAVSPAAPNACQDRLEKKGYTKKCRTHGTQAGWGEVWCAKRTLAAQPSATDAPKAPPTMLWLFFGATAALGLVLFFRRGRSGKV